MVDGSVFLEAESGRLKTYCKIGESADASGGKYVTFGEKSNKIVEQPLIATDKAVNYEFEVDYSSRFYVWARVRSKDAKTNMLSVIINNKEAAGTVGEYGEFVWVQLGNTGKGYILNEGMNKISLVPKTMGIEVDEILITRKCGIPAGTNVVDDSIDIQFSEQSRFNLEDVGYGKYTTVAEQSWNVSDIRPVEEHPRVYFRKEDIPRILENAQKPENKSAWEVHLQYVADKSSKPSTEMIEAKALDYALRGNIGAGKAAVKEALDFYKKNGASYAAMTGDTYNQLGLAVRTLAEVYDWCYDLLNETEKKYIIDEMIMLLSQGNNGELRWPLYTENAFVSHQAEGLLQNDVMAMAIAIYDERQDIYNFVAGRFFNEFVEYRKWIFSSHTFNQGLNYLDYRLKAEGMTTFLIDSGLDIPSIFGDDFSKVPYRRLYMYRPDGFWLQEGDTQGVDWSVDSKGGMATWLVASYYKDPYLKQAYLESNGCYFKYRTTVTNNNISTSQWLMFNDPDLEGRSERELPLSKYYPSPAGGMTARTGWTYGTDSPTVVADMKIDESFVHGHDHWDSGSFQLYYKGYLARESGIYKITNIGYRNGYNIGSSEFLSEHHSFFYTRAIAHNVMRVYDPNEEFWGSRNERTRGGSDPYELDIFPNDGGQRQIVLTYETDFETLKETGKTGEVLAHEYGEDQIEPDFTYLKGDLSYAYSDKIDEYERSFMFLNNKNEEHPATLIVFDRMDTSDKSFKKIWQMYGTGDVPQINGTRVVFKDDRTEQNGRWDYNGQLTIDTLMPAHDNVQYNVIGGDGQWAMVDGVDYPAAMPTTKDSYRPEYENYRLEISPKEEKNLDYFLNVIQVGDADGAEPYTAELIETDKLAGCVVGDRVVVFGKRKERTKEITEFSFNGEGSYKITVADMQSGTWSAYRNGEYVGDYGVTEDGGVLTLDGAAGEYRFVYKNNILKVYETPDLEKQSKISLYINSTPAYMAEPAYINDENVLMVPLRNVFEKFGVTVEWDDSTSSVRVAKGDQSISVRADSKEATKTSGELNYSVSLCSEAVMKNGVMMVPFDSVQYIVGGVSHTLDDLTHRLNVGYSEVALETDIIEYTIESEGKTDKIYKFGDLMSVNEILIKGEEGKCYDIETSLDGVTWTHVPGVIEAKDGDYVALGINTWCSFVKIVTNGNEVYDQMMLGYTDEKYDRIVDVEWSAENNSNETGLQAIDGNTSTLWSAEGLVQYLTFDLGLAKEHEGVEIMWNKGNERQAYFDILGSDDNENWTYIIKDGVSSGTTNDYEHYTFENSSAFRYIKVEMHGTSTGKWNAIKELKFLKEQK